MLAITKGQRKVTFQVVLFNYHAILLRLRYTDSGLIVICNIGLL